LFSTWANEEGLDPHLVEVCLAHVGRDKVRNAYCKAKYIEPRRKIMQAWSDFLGVTL